MNKNTLIMTLAAAGIVTAIGVGIKQSDQGQTDMGSDHLLPELAEKAQQVERIKIESAGNTLVVESHKTEAGWVIDNLGNYVADVDDLSGLLNALKDARKVEAKTAKPVNFHHLGLRSIDDAESKASLITLTAGGQSYKVLVGDPAKAGSGQYVRMADDNQTWLIDKGITKPEKAEDWVNDKLFDFAQKDIQSVTLSGKYNYALTKADAEASNFTLDSVPEDYKLKYDSIVDAVPRNVSNLRFEALTPAAQWVEPAEGEGQTLTVELFESDKSITLATSKVEDKYYLKLSGDNPLWNDWIYQISEYNFNQLVKDKMDYLDAPQPEAPAEADTTP